MNASQWSTHGWTGAEATALNLRAALKASPDIVGHGVKRLHHTPLQIRLVPLVEVDDRIGIKKIHG